MRKAKCEEETEKRKMQKGKKGEMANELQEENKENMISTGRQVHLPVFCVARW